MVQLRFFKNSGFLSILKKFEKDTSKGHQKFNNRPLGGFYVRNDLSFNLPYILKTESLWAKAITPSLFFDYGLVKSNVDDSKVELSGSGMKIALEYGFFDASISYALSIKKKIL